MPSEITQRAFQAVENVDEISLKQVFVLSPPTLIKAVAPHLKAELEKGSSHLNSR